MNHESSDRFINKSVSITKVDILNQHFYNDISIKICHRPCKIRRDQVPTEISDFLWNKFCDDVDNSLQLVNEAKRISRRALMPSFILLVVFLLLTVGPAFVDYDFDYRGYISYAVIGVWILFQIYIYCRVRTYSKTAFDKVSQICKDYSDRQIKFFLFAEKKRHFRIKSAFMHKHYVVKIYKKTDGGEGEMNSNKAFEEEGESLFPINMSVFK